MNLEEIIDGYNDLRDACYKLMREDPEVLGRDKWLQYAIQEQDIQLDYGADKIYCTGTTYTTQTMSNESFEFAIPFERLLCKACGEPRGQEHPAIVELQVGGWMHSSPCWTEALKDAAAGNGVQA